MFSSCNTCIINMSVSMRVLQVCQWGFHLLLVWGFHYQWGFGSSVGNVSEGLLISLCGPTEKATFHCDSWYPV